MIKSMN